MTMSQLFLSIGCQRHDSVIAQINYKQFHSSLVQSAAKTSHYNSITKKFYITDDTQHQQKERI